MSAGLEVLNSSGSSIFSSNELHMRLVKVVQPNSSLEGIYYEIYWYTWQGTLTDEALLVALLPEGRFYNFELVERGHDRFPTYRTPANHNLAVVCIPEGKVKIPQPTFYIFDKAPGEERTDSFGIVTYRSDGSVSMSSSTPLLQIIDSVTTQVIANKGYYPVAYVGNMGTPYVAITNLYYIDSDSGRRGVRVKREGNSFYMGADYHLLRGITNRTHKINTVFIAPDSIRSP